MPRFALASAWTAFVAAIALPASPPLHAAGKVDVAIDRTQADAALEIIASVNRGEAVSATATERMLTSKPYRRLHERETAMRRTFTDADFVTYLTSGEVRAQEQALRATLDGWRPAMVDRAAARAFAYLPAESNLRASLYPMIKMRPNTFVFDLKGDPAIFYSLNPVEPQAKVANTLAHELHHIGFGQNCGDGTPPATTSAAMLRTWLGAFGEGLAMLAAAGGPTIHPHASGTAQDRAAWDRESAAFATHLRVQQALFRKVLAGTAGNREAIDKAMFAFFGEAQGPWYSVGWRMAVTIEEEFGRAAVVAAFCKPSALLQTYNRAADARRTRTGVRLPKWDRRLAARIAAD